LIHRLRAAISRSGVKALENPAFVRRLDGEELLGSRRVIANLLSSPRRRRTRTWRRFLGDTTIVAAANVQNRLEDLGGCGTARTPTRYSFR
jgi:hypothetical protein